MAKICAGISRGEDGAMMDIPRMGERHCAGLAL